MASSRLRTTPSAPSSRSFLSKTFLAAWLVAVLASRTSSMGALAAASISTFLLVFLGYGVMLLMGIALTILLFWRHRANIHRIRAGKEPKIGQKG